MEQLIELLKQEGLNEEAVSAVTAELEAFKSQVQEEAKNITEESIQAEIKSQVEEKALQLEEVVETKMQEEIASHKSELSSRVSVYLESKTAQLKQEAYQQVLEENQETDEKSILAQIANLAVNFYEEGSEEPDTSEVDSLKEQVESLKQEKATLKLESIQARKQAQLLEESLASQNAIDDDEVGGDDLLEEGNDADASDEDNTDKGDLDIVSLTAQRFK